MSEGLTDSTTLSLNSPSGLALRTTVTGALQRFDCGPISLLLFLGNEVEGWPANLYLRRHSDAGRLEWTPLLGPRSPTTFRRGPFTCSRLVRKLAFRSDWASAMRCSIVGER